MVANIIPGWLGIKLEKKLNVSVQNDFYKISLITVLDKTDDSSRLLLLFIHANIFIDLCQDPNSTAKHIELSDIGKVWSGYPFALKRNLLQRVGHVHAF